MQSFEADLTRSGSARTVSPPLAGLTQRCSVVSSFAAPCTLTAAFYFLFESGTPNLSCRAGIGEIAALENLSSDTFVFTDNGKQWSVARYGTVSQPWVQATALNADACDWDYSTWHLDLSC